MPGSLREVLVLQAPRPIFGKCPLDKGADVNVRLLPAQARRGKILDLPAKTCQPVHTAAYKLISPDAHVKIIRYQNRTQFANLSMTVQKRPSTNALFTHPRNSTKENILSRLDERTPTSNLNLAYNSLMQELGLYHDLKHQI